MSKIERTSSDKSVSTPGEGGRSAQKVERPSETAFSEALERVRASGSVSDAELDEILKAFDAQAKRLVEHPTPTELAAFRELVRRFLDRVVGGAYKVAEVPSVRFAENQKIFVVARKIDEALEALAAEVLSGHATAVSILRRTDEIRGLLLDLRS